MDKKINLKDYVRVVPDFPISGVSFKDISPLLGDGWVMQEAYDGLKKIMPRTYVSTVISPESRGFIFGPMLAKDLPNASFVMVRKQKSLVPSGANIIFESSKEYGVDILGFNKQYVNYSGVIVIHDDVLASGNTALSIFKALNTLRDNVYFNFLIELEFLGGRELLRKAGIQDSHIKSLIKYK